ncbi:hypothetical protein JTB14_028712 [Gonioctena quinquepunctata]|nr:hypothetical protein JTB14_028712 [Gonioctena quinquepunctata]
MRSECLRASGGTSVFIPSDLQSTYLPLNTELEAVAVTTWCPNKLTICSIYIPPSHTLTECELVDLIYQLPSPFIIVGDFNAHNEMWGSTKSFGKGNVVQNVINITGICLLNSGSNTHFNISSGSFPP